MGLCLSGTMEASSFSPPTRATSGAHYERHDYAGGLLSACCILTSSCRVSPRATRHDIVTSLCSSSTPSRARPKLRRPHPSHALRMRWVGQFTFAPLYAHLNKCAYVLRRQSTLPSSSTVRPSRLQLLFGAGAAPPIVGLLQQPSRRFWATPWVQNRPFRTASAPVEHSCAAQGTCGFS